MKKTHYLLLLNLIWPLLFGCTNKQAEAPKPYGPLPSEAQLKWQELEFYAFIHFSMNTFTDMEWGFGDKDPQLFNPEKLDTRQWCKLFKEAGMKGVILTAKHHDGFCLWPSEYTEYSVKNSPWREGKGDLVKELAEACKEYGLKLGIYLSPWDRNHSKYGTDEYISYFRNQLTELLSNYGDVFEVWFDGANGGSGYYGGANEDRSVDRRTYYDWPTTNKLVKELQPNALIFSDGGPDIRWCGNESGWIKETNWSLLRRDEVWPGYPRHVELQSGHEDGNYWVPAEVNVSIRPGWFYHKNQDNQVKELDQLLDIYYHSIGRNATWNLNIPIAPTGLVHPNDSARLVELGQAIQSEFKTNLAQHTKVETSNDRGSSFTGANLIDGNKESYWATEDSITTASATLIFTEPTNINRFLVQEHIALGQRVEGFTVEILSNNEWQTVGIGTTIGYKRILRFPTVKAEKVRLKITQSRACPVISNIELYFAPDRTKQVQEQTPTLHGKKYKSDWKVLTEGISSKEFLLDADDSTVFYTKENQIVIDTQKEQPIKGFQYLPHNEPGAAGLIFKYEFEVSTNGKDWTPVIKGEFSNIRNSPVLQTIEFNEVKARFIKLKAMSTIDESGTVSCAEFDLL